MTAPVLIATSHGTNDPAGRAAVRGLVDAVAARLPDVEVREAFVDVQVPAVADVVGAVDGPCVVVPLLLSPGFHVNVDIRQAVQRPGAVAASTLGPDDRLTAILVDRLIRAGVSVGDAVVLAGSWSSDARARQAIRRASELLSAALGRSVSVAFVGSPDGGLEAAVDRARHLGRRVVAANYLLAPGHFDTVLRQGGADLVTSPLLNLSEPESRLVDLVVERYAMMTSRAVRQTTVHPRSLVAAAQM